MAIKPAKVDTRQPTLVGLHCKEDAQAYRYGSLHPNPPPNHITAKVKAGSCSVFKLTTCH
eukprot:971794-Amphidinium_carterae.1